MSSHGFCGYVPQALWNYAYNFDGSTNYIKRTSNLSGISSSKTGFISLFLRYATTSKEVLYASSAGNAMIDIQIDASGRITCSLSNASGANSWSFRCNTGLTINTYYHIMISWDSAYSSGSKVAKFYGNDTDLGYTNISDTFGDANIGWADATAWAVGADTAGNTKFNGCMAQLVFAPGQTLDITNSTNRRKFSDSSFHPIFIGRDGSLPTGTAPLIYLTSSVDGIGVNSGTGGNFDSVNGTFTNCAAGTP